MPLTEFKAVDPIDYTGCDPDSLPGQPQASPTYVAGGKALDAIEPEQKTHMITGEAQDFVCDLQVAYIISVFHEAPEATMQSGEETDLTNVRG